MVQVKRSWQDMSVQYILGRDLCFPTLTITKVDSLGFRNIQLTRSDGVTLKGLKSEYAFLAVKLLALPKPRKVYWYFGGLQEHPHFEWEELCIGCGDTPAEAVQYAIDQGYLEDQGFLSKANNTYWGCKLAFGHFEFKEEK
jgi:hypothetical protein